MTTPQRRIAAFDVDGTLTRRDCVVPFLRRVGGPGAFAGRVLLDGHRTLPALARRDRDRLKAIATRAAFRGRDAEVVRDDATRFARDVAADWMRPDVVERLDGHRAAGDAIVLVSASYELYLRPLADLLGGAAVLGTRLDVDRNGGFTGELDGPNCRGPEKVRRLHEWLDGHGGRAAVHVTAYGDSAGDRELLQDADEAVWLGRGSAPPWSHR